MTTEETIDATNTDNIDFGFAIIKDKNGNYGLKALPPTETLSTPQIYDACHAICRNIQAQETAEAVGAAMVKAVGAAKGNNSGLIVPDGI